MSKTINEVIAEIEAAEIVNGLPSLNTPSATAIRRLWRRIIASVIVTLDTMFDWLRVDIAALLDARRPHTSRWYRKMALGFQYGHDLLPDATEYDNTGLTAEDVDAARIIKQAAATERNNLLIIKAATLVNNQLAPLSSGQLIAFTAYMQEVKDAGVPISIQSYAPDLLEMSVDIYYNPSILNGDGERLDGTDNTPIQKAIDVYLKNLEFNGVFSKTRLTDAIQGVSGVVAPEVTGLQVARWDDVNNPIAIQVFHEPYAGYYTLSILQLNFIARE